VTPEGNRQDAKTGERRQDKNKGWMMARLSSGLDLYGSHAHASYAESLEHPEKKMKNRKPETENGKLEIGPDRFSFPVSCFRFPVSGFFPVWFGLVPVGMCASLCGLELLGSLGALKYSWRLGGTPAGAGRE
jgi:hypothetical protein